MDVNNIPTPQPHLALVVHIGVEYARKKGLGVGLAQHMAKDETGQTEHSAFNIQTRGFKVKQQHLMSCPSHMNMHQRADTLAIRHALRFAHDTVRKLCLQSQEISMVTILNARPCREVFAAMKAHVKGMSNEDGRVNKLMKEIQKLCERGSKVKLALSGHGGSDEEMQAMAAEIAKEKFRRLCRRSPNQRRKRRALRLKNNEDTAQNETLSAP